MKKKEKLKEVIRIKDNMPKFIIFIVIILIIGFFVFGTVKGTSSHTYYHYDEQCNTDESKECKNIYFFNKRIIEKRNCKQSTTDKVCSSIERMCKESCYIDLERKDYSLDCFEYCKNFHLK